MTDISDEEVGGFFRRNRVVRLVSGALVSIVLVAAYLFGVSSYRSGLNQEFPTPSPPAGAISLVIVPEKVTPDAQELPATVLLFPGSDLLEDDGVLAREIQVRIEPAVVGQVITFAAGEVPAPQSIILPATGIVQEYPFDTYAVSATVTANSTFADTTDDVATEASVFVRVPGWTARNATTSPSHSNGQLVDVQLARDWSTKSIALLLLLLMVILAVIAVLVTGAATRGRMKLELSVASWMTALLFALIPIRGFFPGSPPLGSWMDILVFFWVELILMLSVAAVAATILMRARDARHHQEEIR